MEKAWWERIKFSKGGRYWLLQSFQVVLKFVLFKVPSETWLELGEMAKSQQRMWRKISKHLVKGGGSPGLSAPLMSTKKLRLFWLKWRIFGSKRHLGFRLLDTWPIDFHARTCSSHPLSRPRQKPPWSRRQHRPGRWLLIVCLLNIQPGSPGFPLLFSDRRCFLSLANLCLAPRWMSHLRK